MPPVQAADMGTMQVLYPIMIIALGALVKWWMSGTERSIKAVAESVGKIADKQNSQGQDIAVLEERIEQLRKDYDRSGK